MSNPLFQVWLETVARSPRSLALVEGETGRRWSRAALAAGAGEWAAAFGRSRGLGMSHRRRVALSVPNGAEWLQVFLGLQSRGISAVPIDPAEPLGAQLASARATGCAALWSGGRLHPVAGARGPRRVPEECLLKMTSATSGAARGLPASAAHMLADGRQICRTMGIGPADVNLAAIPFGYSYGLGNLVLPLVQLGTAAVCLSAALPHVVAAECRRFRATVFPAVPPLLAALAASDVAPADLRRLRLVISAGSPLEAAVAQRFQERFGHAVHGFYGTSETGGIAFDRSGEATRCGRSVGVPLLGVAVRLQPGGRFTVASPAVLGRGTFRPADRGAWGAAGELVLLGRVGRTVKIAGRRVNLAEIERALRGLPDVRGAFVHWVPGPAPVLAAAVATELTAAEIRRRLAPLLAAWKVPTRWLGLPALPTTARGKTDARRLRQLLAAPRTATSISTFRAARQMSASR